MKKIKFILLWTLLLISSFAFAQRDDFNRNHYPNNNRDYGRYDNNRYNDWTTLTIRRLSRHSNSERINLDYRFGRITQLKFDIIGSAHIYRCSVRYENGYTQDLGVRNMNYNRRNSWENNSIVLTLPNRREIRQIIFWYDTDNGFRGRSSVKISVR